jgi:hypothetical protein
MCLSYCCLCCPWTCLFYCSLRCPGRACLSYCSLYSTAPARVCVFVLQRSILSLEMFSLQQLLCLTWTYLFNSSLAVTGGVWPTAAFAAPVLSVSWACSALMHVRLQKFLCCSWTCLSTRALVCTWGVCLQEHMLLLCVEVYESFVLHMDVSAYKVTALAVPTAVQCTQYSHNIFLFVLVCSETHRYVCFGCFNMCSKHRQKTRTSRKISFLISRNKPKNNRNRFGSFRLKPKIFFVCCEDTLPVTFSMKKSPPVPRRLFIPALQ